MLGIKFLTLGAVMFPNAMLIIGIASVAIVVGYMAGGSGTPVASVAIPAVFGLAVTALGLLQATQPSKDLLEFIKSMGKDADTQPDIVQYRQRVRLAPVRVGVALTVFSVCYIAAASYGATVRINNLLVPKQAAKEFPWKGTDTAPPTISSSLEWLALQSRLSELGYTNAQISSLYSIQVAEWKALEAAAASSKKEGEDAKPGDKSSHGQKPGVSGADTIWRDWIKQGGVKGNPFANQPPKELIERLKELDVPGKGSPSSTPG